MVPENIVWAFSSEEHRVANRNNSKILGKPLPKETYYKDTGGKWVRATGVFDCIDVARKEYSFNDAKYLGAVLLDTKVEVDYGTAYPPPEPKPVAVEKVKKKVKKLANVDNITLSIKDPYKDPYYDYRPYRPFSSYWDTDY